VFSFGHEPVRCCLAWHWQARGDGVRHPAGTRERFLLEALAALGKRAVRAAPHATRHVGSPAQVERVAAAAGGS